MKSSDNNKTIRIKQGEEYRIRLGNIYESDGFFYDVYCHAAGVLNETLRNSKKNRNGIEQTSNTPYVTENDSAYEFSNNIIAFCGGKGEGKSSALRTFANALECLHKTESKTVMQKEEFWGKEITKFGFTVLPVIDPTMMREQDSFMRIILSRMFAQARSNKQFNLLNGYDRKISDILRPYDQISQDLQMKILTDFRYCYEYLDTLNQSADQDRVEDDLEKIADLGDSGNLKNKFRELIRDYLKAMNAGMPIKEENTYLIIQIDDADLSFQSTFKILEDIRSFCMVPEVIILMAVDMDQLYRFLEQHHVKEFEILMKYRGVTLEENPISLSVCRSITIKYIDKIIPSSRQIHLPQIDSVLRSEMENLTIQYLCDEEDSIGKEDDILSSLKDEYFDYQEKLLRWLNSKSGLVMVEPASYRHNFLPGNFRELTHFLAYFEKMDDLKHNNREWENHLGSLYFLLQNSDGNGKKRVEAIRDKWFRNLQAFEQYFLNNWADFHLNREGKIIIKNLSESPDTMKWTLINAACETLAQRLGISVKVDNSYLEKQSFGILMRKISILSRFVSLDDDFCLLYALRLYYTLYIYKRFLSLAEEKNAFDRFLDERSLFSMLPPDLQYDDSHFSFSRFEVNISALCTLRKEFSKDMDYDELFRTLSPLFYIVSGDKNEGVARCINKEDLETLLSDNRDSSADQIHVIFDLSFVLLSAVLSGKWLKKDHSTDGGKNNLRIRKRFADLILQILFNWDVQHYIEKSGISFDDNPYMLDLLTRLSNYLNKVIDLLKDNKCLKDLPSVSCIYTVIEKSGVNGGEDTFDNLLRQMMPDALSVVAFGNETFFKRLLGDYKTKLNNSKDAYYKSELNDEKWSNLKEYIGVIQLGQKEIFNCLPFKELSALHDKIQEEWQYIRQQAMASRKNNRDYPVPDEDSQLITDCSDLVNMVNDQFSEIKLDAFFKDL